MDWAEQLAAGMPRRHEDEPPGLRAAIVAEINDHLQCSLRRELVAGRNDSEARARVLRSFGDPVQVACRMFYDAMKERIIMQRATLAVVLLMAMATVAMCFLVWRGQQESRALNAVLLEDMRAFAQSMQAQARQANKSGLPNPADTSTPLRVKVVADGPAGSPLPHSSVTLLSLMPNNVPHYKPSRSELSDADGTADFGSIRSGNYRLLVETPAKKFSMQELSLAPGRGDVRIVCPSSAVQTGKVRFEIDRPEEFRGLALTFALSVAPLGEVVAEHTWRHERPNAESTAPQTLFWDVLLDAEGVPQRCTPASNELPFGTVPATWYGWSYNGGNDPLGRTPRPALPEWLLADRRSDANWPAMDYAVLEVVVIPDAGLSRINASSGSIPMRGHEYVKGLIAELEAPSAISIEQRLRRAVADAGAPKFTIKSDRENICKLSLPAEFWRTVPTGRKVSESGTR
jgi:hypothetical protein